MAKKAKKKATVKRAKKKTTRKKAATGRKKSARKPNAAFMKPLTVSAALGEVIGNKDLPRTEAVKKMWDYIKKNGLQDKKNRRMINSDEKLKKIFGGKAKVSMFEMAKIISRNLDGDPPGL